MGSVGCRTIDLDQTTSNSMVTFNFAAGVNPHFPTVFNREITREVAITKMVHIHKLSLDL